MPASKIFLTTKANTKVEETEIIGNLLNRLQYLPTSVMQSECPDLEIELNGYLIGIELTKYYSDYTKRGSKTQQKISEWKKFAEQIKRKLSSIKPEFDYLYGSIHFHNDRINYKDLLTYKCINELTNLVISADLGQAEGQSIKVDKNRLPSLSKYIDSIFLRDLYPENIYLGSADLVKVRRPTIQKFILSCRHYKWQHRYLAINAGSVKNMLPA